MPVSKFILWDLVFGIFIFTLGIFGLIENDFFNFEATVRPTYPTWGAVLLVIYGFIGILRSGKKLLTDKGRTTR